MLIATYAMYYQTFLSLLIQYVKMVSHFIMSEVKCLFFKFNGATGKGLVT